MTAVATEACTITPQSGWQMAGLNTAAGSNTYILLIEGFYQFIW